MNHCRRHMAGKITFVATFAAAVISFCGGSTISEVQEKQKTFEALFKISQMAGMPSIMSESLLQETEIQLVQAQQESVDTEELVVYNVADVVENKRENNLYYIIDDGYRIDVPEEWQDYLWNKCVEYDIAEYYELLFAQIYHESSWKPDAVSGTNDYGLMQINENNHEWLKEILGITDFLDPYQSMDAGIYMMSCFLTKYSDVQTALVCYNMGEGKVKEGITSSKYTNGVVKDMDKLFILEKEEGK